MSAEQLNATTQAMRSAEADLDRAQDVRSAGMSTDVDVLSIRVHLAGVREQQIRRAADLDVARAALNDALGLPLDTPHTLDHSADASESAGRNARAITKTARSARGRRLARRSSRPAWPRTRRPTARSNLLPQVGVHAAFEADRQRFYDRGGANWLVSIGLRWNLFNGFSDKARIEESKFALRAARPSRSAPVPPSGCRSAARTPICAPPSSASRWRKASVAEAEESLRITQNRYEAGMSNVTDLLRTETAVLEARTRHLAAIHDQRDRGRNAGTGGRDADGGFGGLERGVR